MELTRLIEALSDPAAYPEPVGAVEVRQTHISAVFLAGTHAYKVKKPVDLGFVDYSTLEKRRHFCDEEVRLNRRLAPEVYRGVVAVTRDGGAIRMGGEGEGEVVEWAVEMERLPDDATLRAHLRREDLGSEALEELAGRIAAFHASAEGGDDIAASGRFDVVGRNARENFEQAGSQVGDTVSPEVFERLRALTEEALARLRTVIEGRAARGVPRDTHGDLRLGHVYRFPGRRPPADWVVVDCIEFNERFRHADPVADMAFLAMDLTRLGRKDLARVFAGAYFRASGDAEGRALLPFYAAYRAAVRGKVEGMKAREAEVPASDRAEARARSRAYWLLALGELEDSGRRPCLVLVGGLPGSGKSTLARDLAGPARFTVIRSDEVRKELASGAEHSTMTGGFGGGIYTPEWNERTYGECLRRAERLILRGDRVLVDANFREEARRRLFLEAATCWGVPGVLLLCRADPDVVRARLGGRRDDASDADWSIYQEAARRWEEPGPRTSRDAREIATGGPREQSLASALDALRSLGLLDEG